MNLTQLSRMEVFQRLESYGKRPFQKMAVTVFHQQNKLTPSRERAQHVKMSHSTKFQGSRQKAHRTPLHQNHTPVI